MLIIINCTDGLTIFCSYSSPLLGVFRLTSDGDQQDEDVEENESTNGDSSKSTSGSAGMLQVLAVVFAIASTVLFM